MLAPRSRISISFDVLAAGHVSQNSAEGSCIGCAISILGLNSIYDKAHRKLRHASAVEVSYDHHEPCANLTGFSCEGPAVLSNFRTASDPTRLGFCVFSCQAAGEKAKGPLPGLPWIFASTAEGGKLVRMLANTARRAGNRLRQNQPRRHRSGCERRQEGPRRLECPGSDARATRSSGCPNPKQRTPRLSPAAARFPCYPLRQRSHAPAHRCQRCRWLHHSPWSPHRDLHLACRGHPRPH